MARLYNSFDFIGELGLGNGEPTKETKLGDDGYYKLSTSFLVKETNKNGTFAQLEALFSKNKPGVVYTMEKGLFGEKVANIQVPWDERLKQSVVDSVADFRKIVIDLTPPNVSKDEFFNIKRDIYKLESDENGDNTENRKKLKELYNNLHSQLPERKEFIHAYDAINYLKDKYDDLKGRKVRVRGDFSVSEYNGKQYTNYNIKSIELVDEEYKNQLKVELCVYYKKDAVDKSSMEKTKRMLLDTYVVNYNNTKGVKKDEFYPLKLVFDASKLDFENEKHVSLVNLIDKTFTIKGKEVKFLAVEAKVVRGAEEVEFNESMLTEQQKEMIALDLATLEDFKPKGEYNGESKNEIRLTKPVFKEIDAENNFKAGAKVSTLTPDKLKFTPSGNGGSVSSKVEEKVETKEEDDLGDAFENDELLDLL